MEFYDYNNIKIPNNDKSLIIYILQVVTLYNAMIQGWNIKKIGKRKYKLSKRIEHLSNFNFESFIYSIVKLKINYI